MEGAENRQSIEIPGCQVCNRQDETLRIASYPFIVSIIAVSFQRAFSGIFCIKHQRMYHVLASLITSTVGWLGIPFGFIMTPITLFRLARGGYINTPGSFQLLAALGDKKKQAGDAIGAIRCFEECLKLHDDPVIRDKLTRLYQTSRGYLLQEEIGIFWQLFGVPLLLFISILTGLIIGSIDMGINFLLYPIIGEESSIIIAILSWLPTVAMIFFGLLLTRSLLRSIILRLKHTTSALGTSLAITSSLIMFYAILEGQSILRNAQGLISFFSLSSRDAFLALRSVLTHGGLDIIVNTVEQGGLPSIIFLALIVSGFGVSLFVNMELSRLLTGWQDILSKIKSSLSMDNIPSSNLQWFFLGGILLMLLIINVVTYPGSYINFEKVNYLLGLGISEMEQEHNDNAFTYFSEVNRLWPDSSTGHAYLGLGHLINLEYEAAIDEFDMSLQIDPNAILTRFFRGTLLFNQGKYAEAIDDFIPVSESQHEWSVPHATLATLYYFLDEQSLADQEIELALTYENNDTLSDRTISTYYTLKNEFGPAETFALKALSTSKDADDYYLLINIYTSQHKFDQAQMAIDEASRKGMDPVLVYLAKAHLAGFQLDFETSRKFLEEGLDEFPDNSDLLYDMGFVELQLGRPGTAITFLEKGLELDPYNFVAFTDLALAYREQGNLEKATETAERGVLFTPKYDRIHYVLGLCYSELGWEEQAVREFETFLDLNWDRPLTKDSKTKAEKYIEEFK